MDERTVGVVEESGEEVGLEGERIRGGKWCEWAGLEEEKGV